jgi:hypothetical protein
MPKIALLLLLLIVSGSVFAGEIFPVPQLPFNPLQYTCCKTSGLIMIDGMLMEDDWQKAVWTEDFVDIEGSLKPLPDQITRVKMLWNEKGLYIGAELQEKNVWATLIERDDVIFRDNDFEVFIDPDSDTHDYYELEVNAYGTLWDLFCIKPYRDRQQVAVNAWDVRNIELGVSVDGTLNNPADLDSVWTVEMLLPWNVLAECAHKPCPPPEGDFWRFNFSRVEWKTDVVGGNYAKKPNTPESNWVWSPQGLVAMHYPERWGYVYFTNQPAGSAEQTRSIPIAEYAKEYLRQLYYRQKQYWFDNNAYAPDLITLKSENFFIAESEIQPRIEITSQSYIITLPGNKDFPTLHIREDGLTW